MWTLGDELTAEDRMRRRVPAMGTATYVACLNCLRNQEKKDKSMRVAELVSVIKDKEGRGHSDVLMRSINVCHDMGRQTSGLEHIGVSFGVRPPSRHVADKCMDWIAEVATRLARESMDYWHDMHKGRTGDKLTVDGQYHTRGFGAQNCTVDWMAGIGDDAKVVHIFNVSKGHNFDRTLVSGMMEPFGVRRSLEVEFVFFIAHFVFGFL